MKSAAFVGGANPVTVLCSNEAASGEKEQLLLNSPLNLDSTVSAEPFLVKVSPVVRDGHLETEWVGHSPSFPQGDGLP